MGDDRIRLPPVARDCAIWQLYASGDRVASGFLSDPASRQTTLASANRSPVGRVEDLLSSATATPK